MDRLWGDEAVDKMNGFPFGLEVERDRFLRLPSCTHPRAEGRGMSGGFVMRMVRGMGHRLRIHHPAQDEQADR